MDEKRVFCCEHGHVIGLVSRNSRGLRELLLYRQAIDPMDERADPPDVMAIVDSAIEIKCSICETARAWVPGEAEMLAIVNRRRRHVSGVVPSHLSSSEESAPHLTSPRRGEEIMRKVPVEI